MKWKSTGYGSYRARVGRVDLSVFMTPANMWGFRASHDAGGTCRGERLVSHKDAMMAAVREAKILERRRMMKLRAEADADQSLF